MDLLIIGCMQWHNGFSRQISTHNVVNITLTPLKNDLTCTVMTFRNPSALMTHTSRRPGSTILGYEGDWMNCLVPEAIRSRRPPFSTADSVKQW